MHQRAGADKVYIIHKIFICTKLDALLAKKITSACIHGVPMQGA
jgi:hypothetical protein